MVINVHKQNMGVTNLVFELKAFKANSKGVLTGLNVSMVTSDIKKIIKTYSQIIGHLFDTIIVEATDKNVLYYPAKV